MSSSHLHKIVLVPVLLVLGMLVVVAHPATAMARFHEHEHDHDEPAVVVVLEASPETQELIDRICFQVEEYGFCNQAFNENLPSPTTDIVGLTRITIDLATLNATHTLDFVQRLLVNTTDPGQKSALEACENGYSIVMRSFQDADVAFNMNDYRSVAKYEYVTPRAEGSCVLNIPPFNEELAERNREMRILITMSLVSVLTLISTQV
ncbi:uncharacterized protein LOC133791884 [Humulus lupulus]|uniref:uncharacterized protein LOC133791884 n=1 Tax=Humulus lupulus TaxID=3486 RepID=UPI002B411CDD|nr:uncharacterized protein LOC133791884 [Humulus lupulus]